MKGYDASTVFNFPQGEDEPELVLKKNLAIRALAESKALEFWMRLNILIFSGECVKYRYLTYTFEVGFNLWSK